MRTLLPMLAGCWLTSAVLAAPPILVVDLSEAYARSTALAGLLADVDTELKALAMRHQPELDRLRTELRELKRSEPGNRDRQIAIARQISDIEAAAERDEERLAAANQTAIAFSNILQTDQILSIYQIDIEKIENERKRIARDLHDHVLNQIAAMRNSLDPKTLPPTFLETYEDIKLRGREIINDLRPTVLDHGLAFALTEYIEDLREMHPNINIIFQIQASEERIPEKMEEHIYYIVREACENALRHANARTLELSGVIAPGQVSLAIQDDGDGFDSTGEINDLIANRHFGLATMKERAHLAGAEMTIQSQKNQGTTIRILWQPKL